MMEELINHPELNGVHESLRSVFSDSVPGASFERNELTVRVNPAAICDVLKHLKNSCGFNALNDIIGLDNMNAPTEYGKRFTILYLLYRFPGPLRVRVRIDLDEGEPVNSAYSVYRSSDWAEREIFDMFGIVFSSHPNMSRIYMPDEFDGYPLRKDFPLEGRMP
jgi:NADH-quinone oxidoreductase subunit C